jgi:hypothetical protein
MSIEIISILMDAYGNIFYGGFIDLLKVALDIPQIRKGIELVTQFTEEDVAAAVNTWMVSVNTREKKFLFRYKINKKFESVYLTLNVLASLNGKTKYYFGLDLCQLNLEDPWRISEVSIPPTRKLKVVKKVFEKYNLGTPKMYLIEAVG